MNITDFFLKYCLIIIEKPPKVYYCSFILILLFQTRKINIIQIAGTAIPNNTKDFNNHNNITSVLKHHLQ